MHEVKCFGLFMRLSQNHTNSLISVLRSTVCVSYVVLLWCLFAVVVDHDGAEPSANSVSAYNLVKLAALVERKEWRERAEKLFTLFSDRMEKVGGLAVPEMVGAFTMYLHTPAQQVCWNYGF